MKNQNYNIGQILFILSQKYNKVIPVKVTEHIISKTAEGEKSKYIVTPYFNKNKKYNLDQLSGTVMFNTQDVYNYMLNNASSAIKGIIEESVENAKLLGYNYQSSEWYKESYRIFNKDYIIEKKVKKKTKRKKLTDRIKSFF